MEHSNIDGIRISSNTPAVLWQSFIVDITLKRVGYAVISSVLTSLLQVCTVSCAIQMSLVVEVLSEM